MTYRKKLIEVAMPLDAINEASAREKSIRHGHPSTLHLWWARRPLAACRAVLFGQLVDDPSAWPQEFPGEEQQDRERERLFGILEDLVKWENTANEVVVNAARLEIARSHARANRDAPGATLVLAEQPVAEDVNSYLANQVPAVHDPFAGGGSLPLEAQRLGLRAVASDLNPVAVLINKALIEIPPRFQGRAPVHPEAQGTTMTSGWRGAQGLAKDVRFYGEVMRDAAQRQIGPLYPDVELPDILGGGSATPIAWIWVRTVPSPDPALGGASVPLFSSFWLCKKKGQEAWFEPDVDKANGTWRMRIRLDVPHDQELVARGTKVGRGNFECMITGAAMPASYIREQALAGRMGMELVACVASRGRRRFYLEASETMANATIVDASDVGPTTDLPEHGLGFRVQKYGIVQHRELFTARQLLYLDALSAALEATTERVRADASAAGWNDAGEYAAAVRTYLALTVSKAAVFSNTLARWRPNEGKSAPAFGRQALAMVWDFAEINPFGGAGGDFLTAVAGTASVLERMPVGPRGTAIQADAQISTEHEVVQLVLATDPPYYDNVGYADLSDFSYVWLRPMLRQQFPDLFSTVLVPKASELIADPDRHGGRDEAEEFFLAGMTKALRVMHSRIDAATPLTVFYAFKQVEDEAAGRSSTGWETFLAALLETGFEVVGTVPMRTEGAGRLRNIGANALATSIVVVCRRRASSAHSATKADFRRSLRRELPTALAALEHSNVAPVDVAQAAIGPGMAVFSRFDGVLEADGKRMPVRGALRLINEVLDELLTEQGSDAEPDTRFAITWFESNGFDPGSYGDAETLSKARNISVKGVEQAGIIRAAAGKVRLLKRSELQQDWDPVTDERLTVWEATQYLIKRLDEKGEQAAADLLARLGPMAEQARALAYRLYTICERKKWADEARAYNTLVVAWPELAKLAAQKPRLEREKQGALFA